MTRTMASYALTFGFQKAYECLNLQRSAQAREAWYLSSGDQDGIHSLGVSFWMIQGEVQASAFFAL